MEWRLKAYIAALLCGLIVGVFTRARDVQRKRLIPDLMDYIEGGVWGVISAIVVVGVVSIFYSILRYASHAFN